MLFLAIALLSINGIYATTESDYQNSTYSSNSTNSDDSVNLTSSSTDNTSQSNSTCSSSVNSTSQSNSTCSSSVNSTSQSNSSSDNINTLAAGEPSTTFTIDQIKASASIVRKYIETYNQLPDYVLIGTTNVTMSQFLKLLVTATIQINNGNNDTILLKDYIAPTNQRESISSGNIPKSEYLQIAADIINYMDSSGKAPDYAYGTSLGTYLRFENLVYMYSMIMDYYNTSGRTAGVAIMKPWFLIVYKLPAGFEQYIVPTSNCQSDDSSIVALASSITAGANSPYEAALLIFNWVRDNIDYEFYYNTQKGAVGTLNSGGGNCVDTAHLLIALERAVGIPARYVHGYCQFSSGSWYGHVWANVYIDGQWIVADATSSRNQLGVINNWNTGTYTLYSYYTSLPF